MSSAACLCQTWTPSASSLASLESSCLETTWSGSVRPRPLRLTLSSGRRCVCSSPHLSFPGLEKSCFQPWSPLPPRPHPEHCDCRVLSRSSAASKRFGLDLNTLHLFSFSSPTFLLGQNRMCESAASTHTACSCLATVEHLGSRQQQQLLFWFTHAALCWVQHSWRKDNAFMFHVMESENGSVNSYSDLTLERAAVTPA